MSFTSPGVMWPTPRHLSDILGDSRSTYRIGQGEGDRWELQKTDPDRWETDLTPDTSIDRIMGMMRLVWEEVGRHEDETQPIGVSSEAAEIVVQTEVLLVTLAVVSALLGFDSHRQFVRCAKAHLGPWFPYVPNHEGFNMRLHRDLHCDLPDDLRAVPQRIINRGDRVALAPRHDHHHPALRPAPRRHVVVWCLSVVFGLRVSHRESLHCLVPHRREPRRSSRCH